MVLSGDVPLISSETIAALLGAHEASPAAATMLTIELERPGAYGRVLRDQGGEVLGVIETKAAGDASAEQLAIREVNAGTYAFDAAPLAAALGDLSNDNAQGEYYLPDVFAALREGGHAVAAHVATDLAVTMGVNNRVDLAAVEAEARRRILEAHMLAGVTVVDPASTWIEAGVQIGTDVRIEPGSSLRGRTEVGSGSVIGPLTTLTDSRLGERVSVAHSYLGECEVGGDCRVGPFAHLRPARCSVPGEGGLLRRDQELRPGRGGQGSPPRLRRRRRGWSGSNLGAGTITANYDGFRKNRTVIGKNARIGVDTMLVAPVEVGDAAYTGAGAVIRDDVPEGALGVSQNEQRNIDGYAKAKAVEMQEGKGT